jgi:hypothetical protein
VPEIWYTQAIIINGDFIMAKYEPSEVRNFSKLYSKSFGDVFKVHSSSQHTPESVYDMAVKYFEWAESNSLQAAETAAFQGRVSESKVHKVRVFTMNGFRLFSGMSEAVIVKYRKDPQFKEVIEFIDSVIYEQKFQLAANGIINGSFIGKEMGIDKPANITVETISQSTANVNDKEALQSAVKSVLDEL